MYLYDVYTLNSMKTLIFFPYYTFKRNLCFFQFGRCDSILIHYTLGRQRYCDVSFGADIYKVENKILTNKGSLRTTIQRRAWTTLYLYVQSNAIYITSTQRATTHAYAIGHVRRSGL